MSTDRVCGEGARNQATKLLADDDDKYDVSASAVLVPGDVASGSFEMVAVVVDIEVVAINLAFSVVVARPKASET